MTTHRCIHFINFSRKLTVNSIFFLIPLHFLKAGFSGWQIGFVMAFYALAPLVFSFPVGWINDRFSIRRVIRIALLLLSFCFLSMSLTTNYLVMASLFLLMGLANNALDVSTNSFFYKDKTQMDQNKKYSRLAFWLAMGMAVGTSLGGFLIYFADFRVMFYIYAVFSSSILFLSSGLPQERLAKVSMKEYRLSIFNRKTAYFSIMIFLLTLHWGVEGTVYSPFLKKHFLLNNLQVSLYISLPLFVLAFSSFSIGLLRYNALFNKRLFLLSMSLSGIGHILMVKGNVYFSFLFRIVHEIGDGFLGALIVLYISRLFVKRSIGGSAGILLIVMTLGHVVGSLLFSSLGFKWGLHLPFILSGSILLVNTIYGWWVFRIENY